ncbi:hypothetical protein HZS_4026, partial [Henneguya salminicola]
MTPTMPGTSMMKYQDFCPTFFSDISHISSPVERKMIHERLMLPNEMEVNHVFSPNELCPHPAFENVTGFKHNMINDKGSNYLNTSTSEKCSSTQPSKKCMGRKESHNIIERRYRSQISKCFSDLEYATFASISNENGTHTKSMILKSAADKIKALAADNERLIRENAFLKEKGEKAPVCAESNKQNTKKQGYVFNGTNGTTPFFIRGNNSSNNFLASFIVLLSFFLCAVDKNMFSKGFDQLYLSELPITLFCISLVCWLYLNWKSRSEFSRVEKFKIHINQYKIAIEFDEDEARAELISAFECLFLGFSVSKIESIKSKIFYPPLVYIFFRFKFLWQLYIGTYPFSSKKMDLDLESRELCKHMNNYINLLIKDDYHRNDAKFSLVIIKCVYYLLINNTEIPTEEIESLYLTFSLALAKSHKQISRIIFKKVCQSISANSSLFWISHKLTYDVFIHNSEIYTKNNNEKIIFAPTLLYCHCIFAKCITEKIFTSYVQNLWGCRDLSQTCTDKLEALKISYYSTNNLLNLIRRYFEYNAFYANFIQDIIYLTELYTTHVLGPSILSSKLTISDLNYIQTNDVYVNMIKEVNFIMCRNLENVEHSHISTHIKTLSLFLQSKFRQDSSHSKFTDIVFCIVSDVLHDASNKKTRFIEKSVSDLIFRLNNHLILSKLSSKHKKLNKQCNISLCKIFTRLDCNPTAKF